MTTLLLLGLKSSLLFAGAWALCLAKGLCAAQRHLILILAILGLPVLVLVDQFPINALTFSTPNNLVAWEPTIEIPAIDLEPQGSAHQQPWMLQLREIVAAIYFVGALVFLFLWLARIVNTRRWIGPTKRLSSVTNKVTTREVPLRESTHLVSPMTWGVVAPKILVPQDWAAWSENKKQVALVHELEHIARHDTLTTMLSSLVCCVFWLHPMIWVTHRKMRLEAERACDDAVIESGASNVEYADLLLKIARNNQVDTAIDSALGMASPQMLSTRIHAILNNHLRRNPMNQKQFGLALFLATLIVVPLGSLKAAKPAEIDNDLIPMSTDADLMPIVKVAPAYPQETEGIEGYVVVEFTVSETGSTTQAVVVSAEPAGVFEESALQAVSHYKYKPQVVDGKPVAVAGIRNRITYKLSGGSSVENNPIQKVPVLGQTLFSHLEAAQALISEKDFKAAKARLDQAKQQTQVMNGNELGQLHNMAGFLAFSLGDNWQAIVEYEQVIAQGDEVPQGLRTTTLFTLAQLNFAIQEYDSALRHIEQWMHEADNPGPTPLIFMAQTYYQLNDYPAAIERLEVGLDKAKQHKLEIKENWWALLAYLYYEEARWNDVVSVLETLIEKFPDEKYNHRLLGVQGILANQT